ncbi:MBL fold metallo-hydrolase [Rhizosphaericola mali]|uniref:MBL fold metallo-hydrolase n=1 Tax=Rhizosphaericola mali TaxID=2545455 RepID=A0A5P2G2Y8_9BACT|nr:MBL fold metallo-hydrolase [Rhizosphaericola mali]QES89855.1 MBL fold metallo-hydrolase [Rhizosphaericola mali]
MTGIKKYIAFVTLFLVSKTYSQGIDYNDALLSKIRIASNSVPGKFASEIHYIKYAESPRTFAATVDGGDEKPYIQARTAYQLIYPDGTVMIDAGMDKKVHEFFGQGKVQPYFPSANDSIQKALLQAKKIIITHEHGDHVAGVLRTKHYKELAPKTIVTVQQMHTLSTKPQMPELKIDSSQWNDFDVVDFYDILPVAPSVVLIKAPGHTPGEIMVYTKLANGKEYIFTGDVSWSYIGIEEKKQKPAGQIKRIGENAEQIGFELNWLNQLPAKGIQLLVSHDDIVQPELLKKGIIKKGLQLN